MSWYYKVLTISIRFLFSNFLLHFFLLIILLFSASYELLLKCFFFLGRICFQFGAMCGYVLFCHTFNLVFRLYFQHAQSIYLFNTVYFHDIIMLQFYAISCTVSVFRSIFSFWNNFFYLGLWAVSYICDLFLHAELSIEKTFPLKFDSFDIVSRLLLFLF